MRSSPSWPGEGLLKNPGWRRLGDRPLLPSHCTRSAPSQGPAQGSRQTTAHHPKGQQSGRHHGQSRQRGAFPPDARAQRSGGHRAPPSKGSPGNSGPRAWGASQGCGDCLLGNLCQCGNHQPESPKVGPGRGHASPCPLRHATPSLAGSRGPPWAGLPSFLGMGLGAEREGQTEQALGSEALPSGLEVAVVGALPCGPPGREELSQESITHAQRQRCPLGALVCKLDAARG